MTTTPEEQPTPSTPTASDSSASVAADSSTSVAADSSASVPEATSRPIARETPATAALAAEEAAQVEAERKQERVHSLVSDAYTLATRGDYDMAIRLAIEASLVLPDATTPHAALASFYERLNRMPEAIAAQERVVALNPGSDADRHKLDQMRRGVHTMPRRLDDPAGVGETTTSRSWMPLAVGSFAALGVLTLGLSWFSSRPKPKAEVVQRPAVTMPPTEMQVASVTERPTTTLPPQGGTIAPPTAVAPAFTPLPSTPIDVRTQPLASDPARTPPRRPRRRTESVVETPAPRKPRPEIVPGIGKVVSTPDGASIPRAAPSDGSLPLPGAVPPRAPSGTTVEQPQVVPAPVTTSPSGSGVTFAPEVRRPYIQIEVKPAPVPPPNPGVAPPPANSPGAPPPSGVPNRP